MIINRYPDTEIRLKGEFNYLVEKYPYIAFNYAKWNGELNTRDNGKRYLFATEGYITAPKNYSYEYINKYDGFLTCNSKFKAQNPQYNIILTNGPIKTDDYYELESFKSYDDKIKGICGMLKMYHTGQPGDILSLRDEFMQHIKVEPNLIVHTYGPTAWGKTHHYKGFLNYKHSHYEHLKKMNDYLFCWCPEPMYHELWSWDWITERLFNCFKSKVIPIYIGCYNIEEHVPSDLYIDFRKFQGKYDELSEYLITLSNNKKKCIDMIESAYEWNKKSRFADIEDLESIFQSLPNPTSTKVYVSICKPKKLHLDSYAHINEPVLLNEIFNACYTNGDLRATWIGPGIPATESKIIMDSNPKLPITYWSTWAMEHWAMYSGFLHLTNINKKNIILDAGCGAGFTTTNLAYIFNKSKVIGVDLDTSSIVFANKYNNHKHIQYINCNLLDFAHDEKFDIIYLMDTMEHLNASDHEILINKLFGMLNPHGYIFITTPNVPNGVDSKTKHGHIGLLNGERFHQFISIYNTKISFFAYYNNQKLKTCNPEEFIIQGSYVDFNISDGKNRSHFAIALENK